MATRVGAPFEEDMSEQEMDMLLTERWEEIETILEEARVDQFRGDEAPLEPLQEFLLRVRKQY